MAGLAGGSPNWAIIAAKFLVDPIWWFYLFWIPDFLHRRFGLNLSQIGTPIVTIYVISDAGSVAGGWCSSRMMKAVGPQTRAAR